MKELLDGFSVERLEEIASLSKKELSDGTIIAPDAYSTARSREIVDLARIALAVKQAQLSDLKRFDLDQSNCDSCGQDCGADMSEEPDGDYVLFADVVSNLTALQNFRDAMQGIGHIRRTLDETFGGLHGTHCEPDVLVECKAICDAIHEAYRKSAQVTPDGWQLVPKEPTEAMNKAGWAAINEHDAINPTYRAMLAAAPQQDGDA
ncbi:hypothetical protein [Pseudomonas sp.]|uniref:hypothetical protein n=1 Tax=Pseudomonas sp. TaxID=306 RepID=UPI00258DBD55|nr:hypothetical protein [Pseudomonas sp.]